jgi:hypothetical protein
MSQYLKTFFTEKNLPLANWELQAENGTVHLISNEVVIESILAAGRDEQTQIGNVIRKIDFMNGDVNDFLRHLAGALINRVAA